MPDAITDLDRSSERFQYHAAHPEVTFLDYLESKIVAHARSFSSRQFIYLDTMFWVRICRAALDQPKATAEDRQLLANVRESVAVGLAVFPFSTPLWFETFHQSDPVTRVATARLIDELSLRLTLFPENERIATEFSLLVRAFAFKKPIEYPAEHLVWAVPFCGLGIPFVESQAWSETDAVTIQKTLLDQYWDAGFAGLVAGTEDLSERMKVTLARGAAEMNAFRSTHVPDNDFFKEHVREFVGALRAKRSLLAQVIALESCRHFKPALPLSPETYAVGAQKFSEKILESFLQGRLGNALPSLEIPTALHAVMGRSATRKFKENDYHDIAHATAALSYCDCFATERSLAHLLTNELKYDARFSCTVVTSSRDLIHHLEKLSPPAK